MARKQSGGFNKLLNFIGLVDDEDPRDTYGEEYSGDNYGRQSAYTPRQHFQRPEHKAPTAPTVHMGAAASAVPARPQSGGRAVLFRTGERVTHSAFGEGMVTQTIPMGGDMLLTIRFDSGSEKKFLANAAARFIKKL